MSSRRVVEPSRAWPVRGAFRVWVQKSALRNLIAIHSIHFAPVVGPLLDEVFWYTLFAFSTFFGQGLQAEREAPNTAKYLKNKEVGI